MKIDSTAIKNGFYCDIFGKCFFRKKVGVDKFEKKASGLFRRVDNMEIKISIFSRIKKVLLHKLLVKRVKIDWKLGKKLLAAFCPKMIDQKHVCFIFLRNRIFFENISSGRNAVVSRQIRQKSVRRFALK